MHGKDMCRLTLRGAPLAEGFSWKYFADLFTILSFLRLAQQKFAAFLVQNPEFD